MMPLLGLKWYPCSILTLVVHLTFKTFPVLLEVIKINSHEQEDFFCFVGFLQAFLSCCKFICSSTLWLPFFCLIQFVLPLWFSALRLECKYWLETFLFSSVNRRGYDFSSQHSIGYISHTMIICSHIWCLECAHSRIFTSTHWSHSLIIM